jgi:hypothetical protein
MSSPAQTVGSWFRTPLVAWMSVRFSYALVLSCVGGGLARDWFPVQEVLPTVYNIHSSKLILTETGQGQGGGGVANYQGQFEFSFLIFKSSTIGRYFAGSDSRNAIMRTCDRGLSKYRHNKIECLWHSILIKLLFLDIISRAVFFSFKTKRFEDWIRSPPLVKNLLSWAQSIELVGGPEIETSSVDWA